MRKCQAPPPLKTNPQDARQFAKDATENHTETMDLYSQCAYRVECLIDWIKRGFSDGGR